MKKLSKAQINGKDEHRKTVEETHRKLSDAIDDFNRIKADAWAKVDEARSAFVDAVNAADQWRESICDDARSFFDEKSDKWQEGDSGQAYSSWLDALSEELEADEDEPEEPGDLETPESLHERIDEIPDEP